MKTTICVSSVVILSVVVLFGSSSCKFLKKKVAPPPQEMFTEAEKLRASGAILEAAAQYDAFLEQYEKTELAPAALYYSGTCKYTLSVECPGEKEFDQRKAGLSDIKKKQYQDCLDYMKKNKKAFSYNQTLDKYLYQGSEFEKLIKEYPASDLVDDAAFQLVRAQLAAKQLLKTLTAATPLELYAGFFQKYPQSPFRKDGVEDLIKLISAAADPLPDHKALVESYQKLAPAAKDLPDLAKLAYLLGKKLIKEGDLANAAPILGISAVVGIGIVETQQTRLNIRGGQSTGAKIVAKAGKGEEVLILEQTGDWYHVQLQDGTKGYAHSEFVKPSK